MLGMEEEQEVGAGEEEEEEKGYFHSSMDFRPSQEERQAGGILTKKVFTWSKAARSSRSV